MCVSGDLEILLLFALTCPEDINGLTLSSFLSEYSRKFPLLTISNWNDDICIDENNNNYIEIMDTSRTIKNDCILLMINN